MRVREVSRVKMAKFQHLLHLANSIRFMQNEFKKQLLLQNVQMDGCVNFNMNGNITVIPCPWEDEKQVTNGESVSYEGGIKGPSPRHTLRDGSRSCEDNTSYLS